MINKEYINKIFHYDMETGVFKRIMKQSWQGNWYHCDDIIKSKTIYGYLQANVLGIPRLVHRLIFMYTNGEFPVNDVDHINGNRLDNRWVNLRLVDRQENLKNLGVRRDNTSGVMGVSWSANRNKWHSYIHLDGTRLNIGHFDSKDDAIKARQFAEIKHGFHTNHGKRQSWEE
jgi:hypothetical protein